MAVVGQVEDAVWGEKWGAEATKARARGQFAEHGKARETLQWNSAFGK